MNFKFISKRASVLMITGLVLLSGIQVSAASAVSQANVTINRTEAAFTHVSLADTVAGIGKHIEANTKETFSDVVFLQLEDEEDYIYIRKNAKRKSKALGKLYHGNIATIIETKGNWTKIESGDVVGYVKTKYLITGKIASMKAQKMVEEAHPDTDIESLEESSIAEVFTYAISRKAEKKAIEAEKAARKQEVVDFAKQFIGNPYVWGGTSLTNGADCSGFVKSVYANFGIYLPHSSYGMRSVGVSVSYSEMQPGDIVCYSGHVGIYAGNGQIVNAIDDNHGIGMSSVTYTNIVAIRRVMN